VLRLCSEDVSCHTCEGFRHATLSFSRDGEWVAYKNEADFSFWRSRSDGTQALRLTFPPLEVLHSTWSPNGMKIAFEVNGAFACWFWCQRRLKDLVNCCSEEAWAAIVRPARYDAKIR
jgi:hypothetical protein